MKPNPTCLFLALTMALPLWAADPPKPKPEPPVFLTPAEAGRDYADQGEFVNDWGGAQVIALGDDAFRLVTYKGGLPGAGWDAKTRREIEGKRAGEAIAFAAGDGYSATLTKDTLTLTTPTGGPYTMKRTVRTSPTLGAKPPAGAVVLFNGTDAAEWPGGHMNEGGVLAAGCKSQKKFGDFSMHCEFLLPFKPLGRGQGRGNSGVYLQDRYELQVLDSFGLTGEHNECGGIYSKSKPLVNMCLPPLVWQTYDIDFQAARFDESGKKTKNAVATIKHNGVTIHDALEIDGPTGGGQPEAGSPGPIQLQGHGNPVVFRNIWVVEK